MIQKGSVKFSFTIIQATLKRSEITEYLKLSPIHGYGDKG